MGGMLWWVLVACFAVSEDPVSIWTTCLKEEVSAWTKVVGYGLADSDLVMGLGVEGVVGVGVGFGAPSPLLLLLLVLLLGVGFWCSWCFAEEDSIRNRERERGIVCECFDFFFLN